MFEKVNPSHPDKVADRIAGAIVDLAYKKFEMPRVAVEVLIGHGTCNIIAETSCHFENKEIQDIVKRIAGILDINYIEVPQDPELALNQLDKVRCGDNGIFKGVPITLEQNKLVNIAKSIYNTCPTDGKYVLNDNHLIVCQSCVDSNELKSALNEDFPELDVIVNPLGNWKGGINVDSGATNRKLGSDMGDSLTGGGLHGKDLSKADVSVNIYAWVKAQNTGEPVELYCAIGDEVIDGRPYSDIVRIARDFITAAGGFEKFAEWGLV